MGSQPRSRVLDAVDALKALDRSRAAYLLGEELRLGPPTGDRWRSVAKLAGHIGEIDLALEAGRRFAMTEPQVIAPALQYLSNLVTFGRVDQAKDQFAKLPMLQKMQPDALVFLGTIFSQDGDFDEAERLYREAIAKKPALAQAWFALSAIKTFSLDDPDRREMERLRATIAKGDPSAYARFLHGLAKAWHDAGEADRAFALCLEATALRQQERRYDAKLTERFVLGLIRDFTADKMASLVPPIEEPCRAIFVNGLPRSGTTLVEQILVSHSQVAEGGEINLLRAAMIPAGDYSFGAAVNYQQRARAGEDPWGQVARDYRRMLDVRFPEPGHVVDKTLIHSHVMGLLLHTLPKARVIWMRRNPEDVALSCFRNYFSSVLPWTCSLNDIGHFLSLEDRLFEHWTRLFPDRILPVPYESLVRDPATWIQRILQHVGLTDEPQVQDFHAIKRSVRTASVQQVRTPISTSRIGQAEAYSAHLEPFRRAYAATREKV